MVTHPAIAIILGSPASGKTSLSLRLAGDLALPCFCKDDVKEALFDSLGRGDREWSSRLSAASFACVLRLAQTHIGVGGRCLIEGNWRAEHVPLLQQLAAANAHASPLRWAQVLCHARPDELVRRFQARNRHPGHLDELPGAERAALTAAEFLDLPGPRWSHDSEQGDSYEGLRVRVAAWFARPD